jgi:hypothetical protein
VFEKLLNLRGATVVPQTDVFLPSCASNPAEGGAPYVTYGSDFVRAPYEARADRRAQHHTAPNGNIRHRTAPYGTVRQRTATYDTVRHRTTPYGTVSTARRTVRTQLLLNTPGHRASCCTWRFHLPAAINFCNLLSTQKQPGRIIPARERWRQDSAKRPTCAFCYLCCNLRFRRSVRSLSKGAS